MVSSASAMVNPHDSIVLVSANLLRSRRRSERTFEHCVSPSPRGDRSSTWEASDEFYLEVTRPARVERPSNLRFPWPIPARMMEDSCRVDERNRKDNRS